MAKFALFLGGADLDKRSGTPGFGPILHEHFMKWVAMLTKKGCLRGSTKLFDQTGARLSVRGGEVVDGPFIETKEAIGGIFFVEVATLEEATALARECPVLKLQRGYVEVRAVER